MEELFRDIERNAGDRNPRPCRGCGNIWQPGVWNFYDLCDDCFSKFDTQKRGGRISRLFYNEPKPYFESADKWIENEKGKEKKDISIGG